MIYGAYTIGGELMHSAKGVEWKNKKYIDKVKTKNGKWRYIYNSPIYKNYRWVKRKVKYVKDYNKNSKESRELQQRADENKKEASFYREHVKDLDNAQKFFGVKNYDEPVRQQKLENARALERSADSLQKAASEAKRKAEQAPQYEFAKAAHDMVVESTSNILTDLGYKVSETDVKDLVSYLIDTLTKKEKR